MFTARWRFVRPDPLARFRIGWLALAVACLGLGACQTPSRSAPDDGASRPAFDVPRMDRIAVDGDAADWAGRGFAVRIMRFPDESKLPTAADFDPAMRVAWDERGLLVLLEVTDDVSHEFTNVEDLWRADSVEVFVARQWGGIDAYQVQIGPGADGENAKIRVYCNDRRSDKATRPPLSVSAASRHRPGQYTVELLLPWSDLSLTPTPGLELAMQLYVNDSDGGDRRKQAMWHPKAGAHRDTTLMNVLRLSDRASAPVLADARGWYERHRRTSVGVYAASELVGRDVTLREGSRVLAKGRLRAEGGRAMTVIEHAMPPLGRTWGSLTVEVAGCDAQPLEMPDATDIRARAMLEQELVFDPFCFVGRKLPSCDFREANLVEDLIGPYEVSVQYFDARFQPVTTAEAPGRYGAVVTISPRTGRPIRRYVTLYRLPTEHHPWHLAQYVEHRMTLPDGFGASPTVLLENARCVSEYHRRRWMEGVHSDAMTAVLLAGLYETSPGSPSDVYHDALARDRQWWVTLKRQLDGTNRVFAAVPRTPVKIDGPRAPVLREGSAVEAGMKPDAAAAIDAVCRAWAADSDEAFDVCVARRGVIVLHHAYGMRDGAAMTPATTGWIASITKLLSAQLMLQMVDAGVVGLDDDIARYLPAFRQPSVARPITMRDLYVHTAGLWGHWGDGVNDLDQRLADMYPLLKVGAAHDYNGVSYELAAKIVETVTGEALPALYHQRLLAPLGCADTVVTDCASGGRSTALDLARVAQMLLNQGAYGDYRFFRPQMLDLALPRPLTGTLGPDTRVVWGIGLAPFDGEGLGEGTYGHGSASRCIFRVDPKNELIITMTRKDAGRNYNKHTPLFFKAITDGIAR